MSPTAPRPTCLDCPKPAMLGSRHCARHQVNNQSLNNSRTSDAERLKNDPLRALYSQSRWRHTRAIVLQRDPLCTAPGCGNRASTVADHYPLSSHEIVEQFGLEEFWNPDRCRGACTRCHDL